MLLRPSVATFEEHERNDLGTALIYAPFPLVLLSQLRRPEVVAAMDQPRRG